MNRILKRFTCLGIVVAMTAPAGVLAQDVAEPAAAPVEPAPVAAPVEPAPVAEPVLMAEPPVMAEPAPIEAPAATEETEPAPVEDDPAVAGWFRVDSDLYGVQLWAGATFPLSDTVGLAMDTYVVGTYGELDIGPSITVADGVSILPMIGLNMTWSGQEAVTLVPQFYVYADSSVVYFEFWSQLFLAGVFAEDGVDPTDVLHLRAFPLFKASDWVAIGIEVDANIAVSNAPLNSDGDDQAILWLPIGPHLKLAAGEASTIELFVGYDVGAYEPAVDADGAAVCSGFGSCNKDKKLAGRFTFTQTF